MTTVKQALESAIDAIESIPYRERSPQQLESIEQCKEALAEVEASSTNGISNNSLEKCEPVAWWYKHFNVLGHAVWTTVPMWDGKTPIAECYQIYTSPPQPREWVGLGYAEIDYFMRMYELDKHVIKAIEAKLRELNTKG